MALEDKRIGKYTDDGTEWPQTTLGGLAYTIPAHTVTQIGGGYFVVLDTWPPRDLDVNGTLDELRLKVSAVAAPEAPTVGGGETILADPESGTSAPARRRS